METCKNCGKETDGKTIGSSAESETLPPGVTLVFGGSVEADGNVIGTERPELAPHAVASRSDSNRRLKSSSRKSIFLISFPSHLLARVVRLVLFRRIRRAAGLSGRAVNVSPGAAV